MKSRKNEKRIRKTKKTSIYINKGVKKNNKQNFKNKGKKRKQNVKIKK